MTYKRTRPRDFKYKKSLRLKKRPRRAGVFNNDATGSVNRPQIITDPINATQPQLTSSKEAFLPPRKTYVSKRTSTDIPTTNTGAATQTMSYRGSSRSRSRSNDAMSWHSKPTTDAMSWTNNEPIRYGGSQMSWEPQQHQLYDLADEPSYSDIFKPLSTGPFTADASHFQQIMNNAMSQPPPPYYRKKPKDRTSLEFFGDKIAVPLGTLAGGALGAYLGGPAGMLTGSQLGTAAGGVISRITGSGDYKIGPVKPTYNTIVNTSDVPKFKSKGPSNVICHREYISDVYSGSTLTGTFTNFEATSYFINPALPATFPWLSTVAAQYEEYIIHGMVFEFKSTSADALNSTNTALGVVIMGTQYNASSQTFETKQQMENSEFTMSARPSINQLHAIECAPRETPMSLLYTRRGGLAPNQDVKTYDLAKFTIATQGMQAANVNLGELWVTYHIEFLKPKLPVGLAGFSGYLNTSNATASNPWGQVITELDGTALNRGNINLTLDLPRGLSWDATPGAYYCVTMNVIGQIPGAATSLPNPQTLVNCTLVTSGTTATTPLSITNFRTAIGASGTDPICSLTFVVQANSVTLDTSIESSRIQVILDGAGTFPNQPDLRADIWVNSMDSSVFPVTN